MIQSVITLTPIIYSIYGLQFVILHKATGQVEIKGMITVFVSMDLYLQLTTTFKLGPYGSHKPGPDSKPFHVTNTIVAISGYTDKLATGKISSYIIKDCTWTYIHSCATRYLHSILVLLDQICLRYLQCCY